MISVHDLSIGHDNKEVVGDLSFTINEGDYVCVIGPNGAGKSTLLKTLVGLKKELGGKIVFSSINKNDIGYLPQIKSNHDSFPASCYEIVLSGCINKIGLKPFFTRREKEKALDALSKLNIMKLKNRCFSTLSGGEQQKVLLARALCASSKIIFLDEPTNGLDPESTSDLYERINELNKKYGLTIVMVTHDIDNSIEYASHVLYINGSNTCFKTIDEYMHDEACHCTYEEECHD